MKRKLLPVVIGSLSMVVAAGYLTAEQAPAQTAVTAVAAPATQPAAQASRRAMGPIVSRLLKMQNATAAVNGDISDEEWKRVQDFMQQHSPDRLKQLNRLPVEKMPNVKRAMVGRFRMLEEVRKSDPVLYDIWVNKLEVEDDHFTLMREWRRGRGDTRDIEA